MNDAGAVTTMLNLNDGTLVMDRRCDSCKIKSPSRVCRKIETTKRRPNGESLFAIGAKVETESDRPNRARRLITIQRLRFGGCF